MSDALDSIRKRPQAERQVIALSIAAVVTGVIFILWLVSFFASIQSEQKTKTTSESVSGFNTFLDSFQEARDVIQEEVGSVQKQLELINDKSQNIEEEEQIPTEESLIQEVTQEEKTETEITPSGIEIIRIEEQL